MSNQLTRKPGRPTKYYPEIIDKIEEYLQTTGREQTELPTIEGLASYLQVNADTIYTWAKEYPIFSENLKKVAEKQRMQLMNDGLYGGKEVNSAMAIFLLKALHGLKENDPSSLTQINLDKGNSITFVNFKDESTG